MFKLESRMFYINESMKVLNQTFRIKYIQYNFKRLFIATFFIQFGI